MFILSSLGFPFLGCHPRLYRISFIYSLGFSSLGHHPRFYQCSFLVPLVSHHQDSSQALSNLIHLVLRFFIIGKPSQFILSSLGFLSLRCHPIRLFICSFGFPSLGSYPRFYLSLFICSFSFSSLVIHLRLNLCSLLVSLVSNHWDVILGSMLILLFLWFVIIGMSSRFYICSFLVCLVSQNWDAILGSI